MKKLLFLGLFLSNFFGHAQYTLIPDVNFENALIGLGIDSGIPDGKVLTSKINTLTTLGVFNKNITDLTGIQDFLALTDLSCYNNQITSLDVTKNTVLTYLSCAANQLTSLNITKNTSLTILLCFSNQITNLDVSKNALLTYLDCNDNKLTGLDVSKNAEINVLRCFSNQLNSLNIKNGKNANIYTDNYHLNLTSNPNLSCIQVDNKIYSDTNWSTGKDATTSFSENCSAKVAAIAPPVITATGNQTYCAGTSLKIIETLSITHDPSEPSIKSVSVQISSGYQNGQDLLTLSNQSTLHSNITSSWNQSEGKLTLSSTTTGGLVLYSDFESALKDVVFSNSSTSPSGIRNFSINLGSGQLNYLPRNQHYYEYVPSLGITWTAAKAAAETRTYYGLTGYLATLTAADEAKLAGEQAPGAGWIGGSDQQTEGVWKWVTGPEAGTIFWNGLANGSTPNFAFWNNNEPNQSGDEDYAHITAPGVGIPGAWNDLTNTGNPNGNYQPKGYIVEYGGMPGDPILQISASTTITIPKIESTTASSNCGPASLTLQATASNGNVYWYTSKTGGTPIYTGNSYTTPFLFTTTSYFVDATNGNCPTTPRTEVIATINQIPTITATTPSSRCDTGTLTLSASSSAGTINWYANASSGTILGSGTSFTTPSISTTTTYYADAVANGCTSPTRTAVIATVNNSPSITSTKANSVCNSGSVPLEATASAGGIRWYDSLTAGNLLHTGNIFTTPTITTTTTYYAEAFTSSCTSPTRTVIIATVYLSPTITATTPSSVCDSGTVTLGATASSGIINWYNVASGGTILGTGTTFTTPNSSSTTTYYVDATVNGCTSLTRTAVTATVNTTPTITSTAPNSRCDTGSVSLGATASSGTINWYNAATGGTSLGTGSTFSTPNITTTTTYYTDATINGCTSPTRTAVIATVNSSPIITSMTTGSICASGSITIGATASSGNIRWYDSLTAGNLLHTGNSYTIPTINTTTTYYIEAYTSTCTIPTRGSITVTVYNPPTIQTVIPSSVCDSGTVTLGATASSGIINWHDVASGGTILGTGTTFTTPNISATTTYYVDAIANGCTTSTRTAVLASVYKSPSITSTSPNYVCDSGTVTLAATASAGSINWYDANGNSLATGNSFTTPNLTTTTNYFVDAEFNGCLSPKTLITATVYPIDTKNEELILCQNETITLDASVSGMNYLWSPGGETTQTIDISSIGDYSVTISSPTLIACYSKKNFSVIEQAAPIITSITVNENTINIILEKAESYYEYSINGLDFQVSNTFSYIPSGAHTAYVRDKKGCNLSQHAFTVFTIAKYFTPNNDGQNDVWKINEMSDYPNSSLAIYNRFGKLLKQFNGSNIGWNGTFNGQLLPSDDYWYRLKLDDTTPEITGHFTLKR